MPRFTTGVAPPGGSLPWGVVTKVHNRPTHASGGTRVEATLIQISVYAPSAAALEAITDRIKAVFVPTIALPIAGGTVLGVYLADDRLMDEPRAATGATAYTFANHLTYQILVSRPN